ncbi:50S ribosomal protein L21 [Candidatus Parcubacteria bacterium]|nr:MAG: 50S ribosomal protein L21 [Candidatus Parcubacteria bacterium]
MFAVIETGGKQYRVQPGQRLRIEKLEADPNTAVKFDRVLLVADGDEINVGAPLVQNAVVEANVLGQGRDKKKIVFKYHRKTRYRKFKGHRQPFTEVEIRSISLK